MRYAPIVNGLAALANLGEALFWYGATIPAPNPQNIQALQESLIVAGENAFIFIASYARKNGRNYRGGFFNSALGFFNYYLSELIAYESTTSGMTYPPISLSRLAQPGVNMIGIGANGFEAYFNLEDNYKSLKKSHGNLQKKCNSLQKVSHRTGKKKGKQ